MLKAQLDNCHPIFFNLDYCAMANSLSGEPFRDLDLNEGHRLALELEGHSGEAMGSDTDKGGSHGKIAGHGFNRIS